MNNAAIKTLRQKLDTLSRELETCKTPAEKHCVKQTIADTERQMWELSQ